VHEKVQSTLGESRRRLQIVLPASRSGRRHFDTKSRSSRPTAISGRFASTDVATALTRIVVQPPANRTLEVAGPERWPLVEFVRLFLQHNNDSRKAVPDDTVAYFGAPINDQSLTPGSNPIIGPTRFETWLKSTATQA
jgi:uncharacterized protein YbjT (DUF2867 family)